MKNFYHSLLGFAFLATAISASAFDANDVSADYIFVQGGAVESGWNWKVDGSAADNNVQLYKTADKVYEGTIFILNRDGSDNEMKFNFSEYNYDGWDWNRCIWAAESREIALDTPMGISFNGEGDYKFKSTSLASGAYDMKLDLNNMTVTISEADHIYAIGSGVGSWDLADAVELKRVAPHTYSADIELVGNEYFKYVATNKNWADQIMPEEATINMWPGNDGSGEYTRSVDNLYGVKCGGLSRVTLTLGATPSTHLTKQFDKVYIMGDAINGYNFSTPMTKLEDGTFVWQGTVTVDKDMKFVADQDDWGASEMHLHPIAAYANLLTATKFKSGVTDDDKWWVSQSGEYIFKLNPLAETITVTRKTDNVYIVGDFTGWSFEPMTHDGNGRHLWVGTIEPAGDNGVKFITDATEWNDILNLHPLVDGTPLYDPESVNEHVYVHGNDHSGDSKWTVSERQHLAIEVYPEMQTVTVEPFTVCGMTICDENGEVAMTETSPGHFEFYGAPDSFKGDCYVVAYHGTSAASARRHAVSTSDNMSAYMVQGNSNVDFKFQQAKPATPLFTETSGNGNYLIMIDHNSNTYTATLPDGTMTGVDSSLAQPTVDATPVYYNLQGIKIDNPRNGIFMVVRGNRVSKEIIK